MPNSDSISPPKTREEAEARRSELTLDVQEIQAQLGDRQRTDENGRRLSTDEYWAWRKKAQHALNQKLAELREIKRWLQEQKFAHEDPGLAITHLKRLHKVMVTLRGEGVEFEPDEQEHIDAAEAFLDRVKNNN